MHRILENKYTPPLVLLVLGFVRQFALIWHPQEVVFDEVHFGKFVSGYLTGEYFFDIHPPLGKLLIALAASIGGFRPGFDFNVIGEAYTSSSYIILRLLPNLFGAFLPVCIFFFVRSLRGSGAAAFFAGLTLVFENAILVQSHFIFVDSMLLLFGFLGLTFFFWCRNYSNKPVYLLASGIFFGCSASVKWTGLSFIALACLVSVWDVGQKLVRQQYPVKEIIVRGVLLIVIPFFVYASIFAVHFSLLKKSGPGDAFMTPAFLKTLIDSPQRHNNSVEPLNFWGKFVELNERMYSANATLSATHSYSSRFYTWPVMTRSVYYWVNQTSPDLTSRIYLLGNPFIWWTAFGAMIFALIFWKPRFPETKWFLYLGWFLNFLPFLNIKRVMFLYHYFPALIFSIVIMSLFFFDNIENNRQSQYTKILFVALIILFVVGFIFFMPLSYGLPLSSQEYELRNWLNGWK
ncbi:MAG TPA: phospholipid carrier-dependent glycosyltransferase [Thermodesulfobacteriota bacterium]|nr:phospholipid carrier-dependent glycosyltransferase [Thermodesulfobacteriota bacterium]